MNSLEMKSNGNYTFKRKIFLYVVFFSVVTTGALIKDKLQLEHNKFLFIIALSSFVALTAKIFGDGKSNRILGFVFWTVCLLMIVDIRVSSITDTSLISQEYNLRAEIHHIDEMAKPPVSVPQPKDDERINALLQCLHKCEDQKTKKMYLTDTKALKYHFIETIEATKKFRPMKRRKNTIYKDYLGPRLEDHFIHNMFAEPYETFAPVVPLFIHWTEVQYSKAGGGLKSLVSVLKTILRKDVIYFSVASCETHRIQRQLEKAGISVIFASSKGDSAAHIVLPHLFRYNPPGFDSKGNPVFADELLKEVQVDFDYSFENNNALLDQYSQVTALDLNRAYHNKVVRQREINNIPRTSPLWRFKNYSSFFALHEDNLSMPTEFNTTFPEFKRFSFVGNLKTHHGRTELVRELQDTLPNDFVYENFINNEQCVDYSAGDGYSACWRTLMLSSGIALSPVGTAPVSYRLYEGLQMGVPPLYIHDERGAFIPYKGTKGDVLSKNGLVVSFENAEDKINELAALEPQEFDLLTKSIRAEIAKIRDTHFTPHGVIGQLKQWIHEPHNEMSSDIRCCLKPTL